MNVSSTQYDEMTEGEKPLDVASQRGGKKTEQRCETNGKWRLSNLVGFLQFLGRGGPEGIGIGIGKG
jgi:hypothetical protein